MLHYSSPFMNSPNKAGAAILSVFIKISLLLRWVYNYLSPESIATTLRLFQRLCRYDIYHKLIYLDI